MDYTFRKTRFLAVTVALAMAALLGVVPRLSAQATSPAEIAAKLTGRWKLDVESTPASAPSGRGRGQVSLAVAPSPVQRGGRGGGGGGGGGGSKGDASAPLMAEEVAAQEALTVLHQVPLELTIEATGETVTFREPRGEWHYTIDGKNSVMAVPGGTLHHKSKWDRGTLHQEFWSAQKKLVKSWSVEANDRLVLTEKFESVTSNSQSKAVFNRQ